MKMVHYLILVEGYPEQMQKIIDKWKKKNYKFVSRITGNEAMGSLAFREVKLYDVTLLTEMEPEFIKDLKAMGITDRKNEVFRYDFGLFKKFLFNTILKPLGFEHYKIPEKMISSRIKNELLGDTPLHCYFLPLARKDDPRDKYGREMA